MDGTLLGGDGENLCSASFLNQVCTNSYLLDKHVRTVALLRDSDVNETLTGKTGADAKAPPAFSGNRLNCVVILHRLAVSS
jgi:hypothetical protein